MRGNACLSVGSVNAQSAHYRFKRNKLINLGSRISYSQRQSNVCKYRRKWNAFIQLYLALAPRQTPILAISL